jgi:hypothetical protein
MGKLNHTPIVTRSRAIVSQLRASSTPSPISRPGKLKKTPKNLSLTMEEQMKQLQLQQEKINRQTEELKRLQQELQTQQELAKQVTELRREKAAQAEALNELRENRNVPEVDMTSRLLGGLVNHFQCLQLEIKAPKFSEDDNQNPLQFLHELENYFSVSNISEAQKLWTVNSSLSGRAKTWWDINKDICDDYENFKNLFKEEFYSVQYRVKSKNRWSARRYRLSDGNLRSYFNKQNREAKYFEPKLSGYEINYAIIQQLPFRIRDILATVDYSNTKLILQTLANLDSSQEEKDNKQGNNQKSVDHNSPQIRNLNMIQRNSKQASHELYNHNGLRDYSRQHGYNSGQLETVCTNTYQPNFILPNTKYPPPIFHNTQIQSSSSDRYNSQPLN